MQYKVAEALLVAHFAVPDEKLGAFRGRLRHLRDLGVPKIGKPGTGTRIDYTRENVIHMALAMHLGDSGHSPIDAAKHAGQIGDEALPRIKRTRAADFWVAVTEGVFSMGFHKNDLKGLTLNQIGYGLKRVPVVHIVNVALIVRLIDRNLATFEKAAKRMRVPL